MQAYRKLKIEKFSQWSIAYTVKYKRDRRNEQANREHARLCWKWQWSRDSKEWMLVRQGCDCSACTAHLNLLSTLNPERYLALTNPPYPDEDTPKYFRPKRLHPSVQARRRQAKTINRFAVQ